jgi:transposase-like protein
MIYRWVLRSILAIGAATLICVDFGATVPVILIFFLGLSSNLLMLLSPSPFWKRIFCRIGYGIERYWLAFTIGWLMSLTGALPSDTAYRVIECLYGGLPIVPFPMPVKPMLVGHENTDSTRQLKLAGDFQLLLDSEKPFDRDIIICVLRLLQDAQSGNPAFTLKAISKACGFNNKQSIDERMKKYRRAGNSLVGIASSFLNRNRHEYQELIEVVEQMLLEEPLLSSKKVRKKIVASGVMKEKGWKVVSLMAVHKATAMIDTYKYRKAIRKCFIKKGNHLRPDYVLGTLYQLIERLTERLEQQGLAPVAEKISLESIRQVASSETTVKNATLPRSGRFSDVENLLREGTICDNDISLLNAFAAVRLYVQGLASFETVGRILGRCRSGVYYWVQRFGQMAREISAEILPPRSSGAIGVDEKWVAIPKSFSKEERRNGKKWRFLYFAVDLNTYDVLHADLFEDNGKDSTRTFLYQLRCLGYHPGVIVTDGLASYIKAITEVFGCRIKHVLCRFHFLQNLHKHIHDAFGAKNKKLFKAKWLHENVGGLFKHKNKATVRDRRTIIKRVEVIMEQREELLAYNPNLKTFFDALQRDLPRVLPAVDDPTIPPTNNATENFIRFFNQHYKTMAGFESMKTARSYVALFVLFYRLRPFAEGEFAGHCPAELAGHDLSHIPLFSLLNQPMTITSDGQRPVASMGRSPPIKRTEYSIAA